MKLIKPVYAQFTQLLANTCLNVQLQIFGYPRHSAKSLSQPDAYASW